MSFCHHQCRARLFWNTEAELIICLMSQIHCLLVVRWFRFLYQSRCSRVCEDNSCTKREVNWTALPPESVGQKIRTTRYTSTYFMNKSLNLVLTHEHLNCCATFIQKKSCSKHLWENVLVTVMKPTEIHRWQPMSCYTFVICCITDPQSVGLGPVPVRVALGAGPHTAKKKTFIDQLSLKEVLFWKLGANRSSKSRDAVEG